MVVRGGVGDFCQSQSREGNLLPAAAFVRRPENAEQFLNESIWAADAQNRLSSWDCSVLLRYPYKLNTWMLLFPRAAFEWVPRKCTCQCFTPPLPPNPTLSKSPQRLGCRPFAISALTVTIGYGVNSHLHQHIVLWHHLQYKRQSAGLNACSTSVWERRSRHADCNILRIPLSFQLQLPELRDPPAGKRKGGRSWIRN